MNSTPKFNAPMQLTAQAIAASRVAGASNAGPNGARGAGAARWLPAERLGQLEVDSRVRPWLIGKGLIARRMQDACGERYDSRLIDQRTGLLSSEIRRCLAVGDAAALFREVELCCADQVWVFCQSVIPDSTLCVHPWLGELGDASLGEMLSALSGVERSSHEYAWLPADDALSARALRAAEVAPQGLWARRARILLRGSPLLAQELFLPAVGRT
ncbi:MAG TPA: chorismate lyase [Steroidobacteraceae bacterium]|nr:chorismate lyase [Steroidobacteraceae bacterium]